jgi:hypothetical protein
MQMGHRVPARERGVGHGAPEEHRAAEDQDSHRGHLIESADAA